MEIYYSILNILDYYAKKGETLEPKMVKILNYLAEKEGIALEEVADANDCGNCKTWNEITEALKELFENGSRI